MLVLFKMVCCALTGVLLHVEIQRGKEPMRELPHLQKFGAAAGCTLRLIEGCQFAGFERQAERARAKLEKKAEVFIADSWFGSVRAAEAIKTLHVDLDGNPAGHEFIGAIKTNHRNFPKQHLEDTMKEWPSGSSLVLECHRPNGVVLLAILGTSTIRGRFCASLQPRMQEQPN
jgi:hypothetical protein